jgi:hypothetical protein
VLVEPHDELEAAFEQVCAAALVERVRAWAAETTQRVDDPILAHFEIDADVAVQLGVTATVPLGERCPYSAPGLVVERTQPYHVLQYIAEEIYWEELAEARGEHARAALARDLQLLAARDLLRGEISDELMARLPEGDAGIDSKRVLSDEEYDAECLVRGNIELMDAFSVEFRPARQDVTGDNRQTVVLRQTRGSRPRERRAGARRSSSRGSPSRLGDDDPEIARRRG